MRLIFLGDVVGKTGRDAVYRELPVMRERYKPDLVVVNGENAAHGFGISLEIYQGLDGSGVNAISHGQVICHVISEQDHRPHVGQSGVAACIQKVGV